MRSCLTAFLALVLLVGCGDSTGPEELVEVHIGHAAPGIGQVSASMAGSDFGPLLPLGDRMLEVEPGNHTLAAGWAAGQTSIPVDAEAGRAYAAVLMDPSAPTLRLYEAALGELTRFTVINAVPGRSLTVSMSDGGGVARIDLGYGEAGTLDVGASTFQLTVEPLEGGEPVSLQAPTFGFEQVFLVIAPGGDSGPDYALLVL